MPAFSLHSTVFLLDTHTHWTQGIFWFSAGRRVAFLIGSQVVHVTLALCELSTRAQSVVRIVSDSLVRKSLGA